MITKGESMIPVTKIDLKDKDGTLLNTEKKYCRQNILVLPKLNPLEVTENGTYPVPQGFAGNGQVKVSVNPKKETALIVTGNGTYIAPPGTVYTSVVVNVPTGGSGDSPHVHKYTSEVTEPSCTMGGYTTYICECGHSYIADMTAPLTHSYVDGVCVRCGEKVPTVEPDEPEVDTGSYAMIVGDVFSISYHGSSPDVVCPSCLTYYDDGGVLVFTAEAAGSGVIRLTRNDSLIGEYTVTVAAVEVYDYDLKIGEEFSVVYDGSSPTVECPSCLTYYDDGGEFVFTAAIVGTGTLRLYRSDSLIASYTIRVSEKNVGSDTHVHSFTHTVTPPTCTEAGYTTHTCTICGFSYRDTPVAARHVPGEPVRVREATCCIPPEYVVYCTRCGQEIYRYEDDGEFAEHIADGGRVTKQPTCTEAGVRTYYCRECSTWMREEPVAPEGHKYVSVVTSATCTTGGYATHTCEKCGHTYTSGNVPALGHTPGEAVKVREETCTVPAEYATYCIRCGIELDRYEDDGEFAEHIADGGRVTKEPTCVATGIRKYYCRECSTWVKDEVIPATGIHSYKAVVTPPTCTDRGYTTHTCAVCGASYTDSETEATGHNFMGGWFVAIAAACEAPGVEKRVCLNNGCNHEETRAIPATGHRWGEPYESNEFSSGYGKKCTVCGELHELTMPECQHSSYSTKITTQPTCIKDGVTTFTCNKCGDTWTEPISATGIHNYVAVVTPPTCTLGGYTTHTCLMCHDSYRDSETDPNGHNFAGGWVIDKAPTCDAEGAMHRTCLTCGHTETASIPATGHDYSADVTDPTCTAEGYTTYTCVKCGDSYISDYTDALGHDEGAPTVTREPTCTVPVEYATYCTRCGIELDRWEDDGEFADHIEDGGRTTREPDCTTRGIITYRCRECDTWLREEYIDALGHDWRDPEPDPSVSSGTSITCNRCGTTEEY